MMSHPEYSCNVLVSMEKWNRSVDFLQTTNRSKRFDPYFLDPAHDFTRNQMINYNSFAYAKVVCCISDMYNHNVRVKLTVKPCF